MKQQRRGHLKIFFGYAAGVGKTYAMLQAAQQAKLRHMDVVAGFIESHARPQTESLLQGLEVLPELMVHYQGIRIREFNLDAAMKRKPQIILIDELAHSNAECCRHNKRYQDVLELLKAGIDVYTTVNVQNIESINDMVASVTGMMIQERIPDSVFDDADQVELVDVEPQELIERNHFYTIEQLTALREIALRRCADRVNKLTETARGKGNNEYYTDEHILVCVSPSPTNAKIIRTAARMANAFRGKFTALFVENSEYEYLDEADKKQLRSNMYLAKQLGATLETVYGDDISFQIAEFARLSRVSKVVIGRSAAKKKYIWRKTSLTEQLIVNAPNLDIHIIPDQDAEIRSFRKKRRQPIFSVEDILKCIFILAAASVLGILFEQWGFEEANIITIYVLAVLITSVVTVNRIYSFIASIVSVLVFNFLFTIPKYTLHAYGPEYPVTFLVMFAAALMTGTLATKLKNSAKQSARSAVRTKILFDTNQLLQQAKNKKEILSGTAHQLVKLLNRDVVTYFAEEEQLKEPMAFPVREGGETELYFADEERKVAEWALRNNEHAGATTNTLSEAKCLYLAIRVNDSVYGVVGIAIGEIPLDTFENSILLSILGECALALENEKNAREKEEAAILAKNEQLRANLLRAISHDLRTPLTSISGNANNLLYNSASFDEETKKELYQDIYDDSMWLINLVENLLSVTRLVEGRLNLHISAELVEEVVKESLRHVNRQQIEHQITVEHEDDLLLAKMDAKLIVQVIINLVDNAIKYTQKGSHIEIKTRKEGSWAVVSVTDDGPGISDENKKHVFEMFYSGANEVADSRRSLGLGLSLCKSIINAHGGTIEVKDHMPQGTMFIFTLPVEEVQLHE